MLWFYNNGSVSEALALCPLKMNRALGQTEDASSKIPREVKLCALISPICSFYNSYTSSLAIPGPLMILSTSETYIVGSLVREVFPPDICTAPPQRGLPSKMAPSPLLTLILLYCLFLICFSPHRISAPLSIKCCLIHHWIPWGCLDAKTLRQNYAQCV